MSSRTPHSSSSLTAPANRTPPGTIDAAGKPAAREPGPQPRHLLFEDLKPRLPDVERGRLGLFGDDVEMAGEPLEFGIHGAPAFGGAWWLHSGGPLDRLAERAGVGDGRDSGDPLGDIDRTFGRQTGESLLHPPVLEERPGVQALHRLAAGFDQELDRLKHTRAHRTVWDGECVQAMNGHVD